MDLQNENNPELRAFQIKFDKFIVKDKIIYRKHGLKELPVIPFQEYQRIFDMFHLPGHLGVNKMIDNILNNLYIFDLKRMIRLGVAHCGICQKRGEMDTGRAPFRHLFANQVNTKIYIDLIGKLPTRSQEGFYYILSIIDGYSKHLTSIPLTNNSSDTILTKITSQYFLAPCRTWSKG